MNKQSSLWLTIGAVVATVLLAGAAVICGFGLSDTNAQKLGSIGAASAAVVGFVGLIVLIVYTRETFLLRLTAEQQLEDSIKPMVILDLSTKESKLGEPLAIGNIHVRNIGFGPAFNVKVKPIVGKAMDVLLDDLPLLEPKETIPLQPTIRLKAENPDGGTDGSNRGGKFALALLQDAIAKGEYPSDANVTVEFQSVSGRRYQVTHHIVRLRPHGIRTDFVKMEES